MWSPSVELEQFGLFNIVCSHVLLLGYADCYFAVLPVSFSACCINESVVDQNIVEFSTPVAKFEGHFPKCIFE